MSYEVSTLGYDELSEEEQAEFPYGEDDTYLRVNGKLYSDGYEPEDVRFYRDLAWVPTEIEKAFKAGYKAGYTDGFSPAMG